MASKTGRPTKYDAKKGEQICALLSEGNFLSHAAALVGVSERTAHRWLEIGRTGRQPYADFADNVGKARAQFIVLALREIRAAGVKGNRANGLAWMLEKLNPRKFGDRVQVHVTAELESVLGRLKDAFASEPSVYERVLQVLAGEPGSSGAGEPPT